MIGSLIFGKRFTIGELMNVDQGRQERSINCSVSLVNTYITMKEESLAQKFKSLFSNSNNIKVCYLTLKLKVLSNTGHNHYIFIQLEPDFSAKAWANNSVRIYCDCNDFKFRSSYILGKRNSLFINEKTKIALGQAMTDAPTGKKGTTPLCKHAYAALSWLMNNYETIMTTL
jgi:hypothetical protein